MADYIMDMIETLSDVIIKAILGKEAEKESNDGEFYMTEIEYDREDYVIKALLTRLVSEGKINEAENLLFKTVEENPSPQMMKLSLEFYKDLGKKTEEELEACGFSKEEIVEGLTDIKEYFIDAKN